MKKMKKACVYLPHEVIMQILGRLPVELVVKCTTVCKTWLGIIKDPYFISSHLEAAVLHNDLLLLHIPGGSLREGFHLYRDNDSFERYKTLYLPFLCCGFRGFRVAGTCNGLICLADVRSHSCNLILWNPSIHKHFTLPKFDYHLHWDC